MKTKELTLLFLLKNDRVLLAMKKRGFGEVRWNGVGGKVEKNETIEQALIRECEEEITVTPQKYHQVADITFSELHEEERAFMHVHVYFCTKWQGAPSETDEMMPQWFNVEELPLDKMWDDDKYWLPRVLTGEKLHGDFTMDDNDKVVKHTIKAVTSF